MADSFFGKLYERARSTERQVIEDFVTEVLARAIHDDFRPLLSVLHEKRLIDCNDPIEGIQAFPQVTIDRAGRIDLLLHIWQKSRRLEGWVEVKINSPESGNQLTNYVAYIRSLPTETRPFLVTLSKEPLNSQVTPITWQALWTASLDSPSAYWRDLRSFLEELEMADQFNAPIDQHEIRVVHQ